METVVWIIQGLLAVLFAMAGITKLTTPKADLVKKMPWAEDYSENTIKFIGTAELLGAIGLIVPVLTGIVPVLTPIAALAIAVIMLLATQAHYRRMEYRNILMNVVLFALAVFVAYYRF